MSTIRKIIRDTIKGWLEDAYDRETGGAASPEKIRKFVSGQWRFGESQLPCLTVTGAGQARASGADDSETLKTMSYDIEILLELKENWDSGTRYDAWECFVQELIEYLQNRLPVAGAMRFEYVGDEPPDVQLTYGPDVSMWVIRFRCEYVVEVGIIGRND